MAGWDSKDGTSVSATERLRAAWAVRLRPAAEAKPKPELKLVEPDDDATSLRNIHQTARAESRLQGSKVAFPAEPFNVVAGREPGCGQGLKRA